MGHAVLSCHKISHGDTWWNVFLCRSRGDKKNVLEPYMNAIEIDMHHEGVIWVMWSWGAIVPASHSSQEVSPGKLWWVPSGQATQILVSAASWQKHAKMQPYIQKHSKSFMASSKNRIDSLVLNVLTCLIYFSVRWVQPQGNLCQHGKQAVALRFILISELRFHPSGSWSSLLAFWGSLQ